MYLGVDVGGTKTLVASLDDNGVITEQFRFKTDKDYHQFLTELGSNVDKLSTKIFSAACIGIPGRLERAAGTVLGLANLPWGNEPIQHDCETIFGCPTLIENDAKLAGLSEAMLLKDNYKRVLYLTVSTGIGYGLIVNQNIDTNIGDDGGNTILLEHNGKLESWESFAAGRAISRRYGKLAREIHDEATWRKIARDLSLGLNELIAITEPEVIVFGGSVGTYFDRYAEPLKQELARYQTPLTALPKLMEAQRPEEAVVYGCYDLAMKNYGKVTQPA